MTNEYSKLTTVAVALLVVAASWLVAQDSDIDGLIAEEELLLEEAVSGSLPSKAVIEELAIEEELVLEDLVEKGRSADVPARKEEPLTLEEPVLADPLEELVVDEPVVEAPLEELVIEIPRVAPPAAAPVVMAPPVAIPAPAMAAVIAPVAPSGMADVSPAVRLLVEQEEQRKKAYYQHAKEKLAEAWATLARGEQKSAITLFEEALKHLRSDAETERFSAHDGLKRAYYELATTLLELEDFEDAEKIARLALEKGHVKAPKLIKRIKAAKDKGPKLGIVEIQKRWRQDDFVKKQDRLNDLIRAGREHLLAGELNRARASFELVLKDDPFNSAAIKMMRVVADRKTDKARLELETTRRSMISEVGSTWNPRDYGVGVGLLDSGEDAFKRMSPDMKVREATLAKMDQIIIPQIEFREANINDVIDFLQRQSVEHDKDDVPEEQRGVNIILHLGSGGAAPKPVVSDDPFAVPGDAGDSGGGGLDRVTFSARYISLLDALNLVTEISGLKYRINGNVVMVMDIDAAIGPIINRTYDVLPSVEERIPAAREGMGGGGSGDFTAMESSGTGTERIDWKDFFESMGVKWPDGSSIRYLPQIGKIVVANTAENLVAFETVLTSLNVAPNQIEIETRFVEVTQSDLDSLGVEWLLTDDWEVAHKKGQENLPPSARERIMVPQNDPNGFTTGNRFLTGGGLGSQILDDVLKVSSVLTNPELSFVLHMLQQRGHADLLSAPKVTTQSGVEASIKVVTEYIYPTEFVVTGLTGRDSFGNSATTGAVVEPGQFETREVGVILSVLPVVSPEGKIINLTLTPEVVTEPDWKNYGSILTDDQGNETRLNMEQPFFHSRSISTTISIYNGATVMMGGMITEKRIDVDDRIPFLGDIPLIGRLFQSRYEASEKRNLLIFVTARLVDPAGRAIAPAAENSTPLPLAGVPGGDSDVID